MPLRSCNLHVQFSAGVSDDARQRDRRPHRAGQGSRTELAAAGAPEISTRASNRRRPRNSARIETRYCPAEGRASVAAAARVRRSSAQAEPVPDAPHGRRPCPGGGSVGAHSRRRAWRRRRRRRRPPSGAGRAGARRREQRAASRRTPAPRSPAATSRLDTQPRRPRRDRRSGDRARRSPTQTSPAPANGISSTAIARW